MSMKSGDLVTYKGKQFYVRLNGSSVFLYKAWPATGKPLHAPLRTSVRLATKKKKHTAAKSGTTRSDTGSTNGRRQRPPKKKTTGFLVKTKDGDDEYSGPDIEYDYGNDALDDTAPHYVYVMRDVDNGFSPKDPHGRVKIGFCYNVAKRVDQQRLMWPHLFPTIIVQVEDRDAARALEKQLKTKYRTECIGGEIFTVHPIDIERYLISEGYVWTPMFVMVRDDDE